MFFAGFVGFGGRIYVDSSLIVWVSWLIVFERLSFLLGLFFRLVVDFFFYRLVRGEYFRFFKREVFLPFDFRLEVNLLEDILFVGVSANLLIA